MTASKLLLECPRCRREVPLGAETCEGCGNPLPRSVAGPVVLHAEPGGASGHGGDVRPQALVAFSVTPDRAAELLREWITGLWFAPFGLRDLAIANLRPVYIPFWSFDAETSTVYRCDVATRFGRRSTWTSGHHGSIRSSYRDVLAVASAQVEPELAVAIEPFHISRKVASKPELLSGTEVEPYASDHHATWLKLGRDYLHVLEEEACRVDARTRPAITDAANVSLETQFERLTSKPCLLPLYVASFRYGLRSFQVLVNGDTGLVHGRRPFSWLKVLAFFAPGVVLTALLLRWQIESIRTPKDALLSLTAAIVGSVFLIVPAVAFFNIKTSEKGESRDRQQW
jgi:hypothetical protein